MEKQRRSRPTPLVTACSGGVLLAAAWFSWVGLGPRPSVFGEGDAVGQGSGRVGRGATEGQQGKDGLTVVGLAEDGWLVVAEASDGEPGAPGAGGADAPRGGSASDAPGGDGGNGGPGGNGGSAFVRSDWGDVAAFGGHGGRGGRGGDGGAGDVTTGRPGGNGGGGGAGGLGGLGHALVGASVAHVVAGEGGVGGDGGDGGVPEGAYGIGGPGGLGGIAYPPTPASPSVSGTGGSAGRNGSVGRDVPDWVLVSPTDSGGQGPPILRGTGVSGGLAEDEEGGPPPFVLGLEGLPAEALEGVQVETLPVDASVFGQAVTFQIHPALDLVAPRGTYPFYLTNYTFMRRLTMPLPASVMPNWWLDPLNLVELRGGAWQEELEERFPSTWIPARSAEDGAFLCDVGPLDFFVVRVWHPTLGVVWTRTWSDLRIDTQRTLHLAARPILSVRAQGVDGRPLARHPVRVAVWLDPASYDWCELDRPSGFARVGVGPVGDVSSVLWREVETDAEGRAQLRVPRGRGYGLLVGEDGRFVFRTVAASASEPHDVALTADLASATEERVALRFLDASGEPLSGAMVRLAVANDAPWVRQFPPLTTDEDGLVRVSGLAPGERVAAVVEHPSLTCPFTGAPGVAWTTTETWTGEPLDLPLLEPDGDS